jgi:hypothetical protein
MQLVIELNSQKCSISGCHENLGWHAKITGVFITTPANAIEPELCIKMSLSFVVN